jgi:hypothetical protein
MEEERMIRHQLAHASIAVLFVSSGLCIGACSDSDPVGFEMDASNVVDDDDQEPDTSGARPDGGVSGGTPGASTAPLAGLLGGSNLGGLLGGGQPGGGGAPTDLGAALCSFFPRACMNDAGAPSMDAGVRDAGVRDAGVRDAGLDSGFGDAAADANVDAAVDAEAGDAGEGGLGDASETPDGAVGDAEADGDAAPDAANVDDAAAPTPESPAPLASDM